MQSVSAASRQAHLSQPAISQAISKLEKTLDVTLFDRRFSGMFVTQNGKSYFQRVERALKLIERGASLAIGASATNRGRKNAHFFRLLSATQLRALVAVSRSNNFTIAARNVDLSQPSLHRAARNLEKLSGLSLFESDQRGVKLTASAKILARYAMLAGAELRSATYEIQEGLHEITQRLYIGSLPLARTKILPDSINALITSHKNVQVQVVDGPYDTQLHRLRHGEIDLIIGALREQISSDDVVQETLFRDRLAIVVRHGHPLARRSNVGVDELLRYDWIAPPRDTPAGKYLFQKLGIADMQSTPVKVVSSSLRMVRSLLLRGDAITIISAHQIRDELAQKVLAQIPIDMSDSERAIGLTYRENWSPTPLQYQFLAEIRTASSNA